MGGGGIPPQDIEAYPPEIDDLYSLYLHVRKSASVAVLEIGAGWSTWALAVALKENFSDFGHDYMRSVRHPNPFQILTIDASEHFQELALRRLDSTCRVRRVSGAEHVEGAESISDVVDSEGRYDFIAGTTGDQDITVNAVLSTPQMGTFRDQVCHFFKWIPPFTADFVYLDGPDCDQVTGEVRGATVNFGSSGYQYGLPMSADVLALEPFFWPGTLLITDGRGANARFLETNFSRKWTYWFDEQNDQHCFRLDDEAWGGIAGEHLDMKAKWGRQIP